MGNIPSVIAALFVAGRVEFTTAEGDGRNAETQRALR